MSCIRFIFILSLLQDTMIRWFYNNVFVRHLIDVLPLYGFTRVPAPMKYATFKKDIIYVSFLLHQTDPRQSKFYFFVNNILVEEINTTLTKELTLIKRILKVVERWKTIEILKEI